MQAVGQGLLFLIVVGVHQEALQLMDHPNALEGEGASVTDTLMSVVIEVAPPIVLL